MIATLGALVLSASLAQVATPAPAAMPSPSAASSDEYIRRGPATAPRMNGPHVDSGNVTIVNSGSTNTAGYTIVIHPNLAADVTVAGTTEAKAVAAPQGRWLFAKVRAAMPLDELPGGRCMKSVSFGSSTTLTYAGQQTPDLSCGGDATTRELARSANVIVDQLHVAVRPKRTIQLP